MQGVTRRITGHHMVFDIGRDYVRNRLFDRQNRQSGNQLQTVRLLGMIPALQLFHHGQAGHEEVETRTAIPPLPRPFAACHHVRFAPHFMVEAGDGRFYVDSRFHDSDPSPRRNLASLTDLDYRSEDFIFLESARCRCHPTLHRQPRHNGAGAAPRGGSVIGAPPKEEQHGPRVGVNSRPAVPVCRP